MVKIILSGACGKMGGAITRLTENSENADIIVGVDPYPPECLTYKYPVFKSFDEIKELPVPNGKPVIIDFSHISALSSVLSYAKNYGLPAVIATTGYDEAQIAEIKSAASKIPVFFSFNMSLGINLLMNLVEKASEVLTGFDIEIVERHHNLKKDSPSGTAIMLANAATKGLSYKPDYVYDRHNVRRIRNKSEIGFHSVRGGTIVGDHDVIFAGHDEVITISHSALSKEVFAAGAVRAAKFLCDKEKGLYDMFDML